jgi:diacylglycerol kinase (ATP)
MSTPLIVNPAAGGGRCGDRVAQVLPRLRSAELGEIEVHRTTGPGHATTLARTFAERGQRTILCAGGDGTTYEVLNGLFPRDPAAPRPRLGLLPLGTGNSFLRDLHIETEDAAIEAVCRGATRPVDVVRADHDEGCLHYLNLLSVGFTSDVGALTNRWFKALGPAGYAVSTVLEVLRLRARPFPVRLDDGPLDDRPADFLSFSNSRCTGGNMQMAPAAKVDDGLLDVIRVGDLGRRQLLTTFPKIYQGRHLEHPKNEATTAARVRFELDGPVAVMVDGEVRTVWLRSLQVQPAAIEVFA